MPGKSFGTDRMASHSSDEDAMLNKYYLYTLNTIWFHPCYPDLEMRVLVSKL